MGTGSGSGSSHTPVLLRESLDALQIESQHMVVDCTFGRGGHTRSVLAELGPEGRVVGLDRDPDAIVVGKELAENDGRFSVVHAPFSDLDDVLERMGVNAVDRILFDLGVSSPQLDEAHRGFSFTHDGPLDMRMDPSRGQSAAEWINSAAEATLAQAFKDYGEERFAKRVARTLVRRRTEAAFTTTAQLSSAIAGAIPKHERHKHPATRCFQAIRIVVNEEFDELRTALAAAVKRLGSGGRVAVISFHSLEDRIVKRFFREQHLGPELPRGLPPPLDWPEPPLLRVYKVIKPSANEIAENPRARSAVLRVAEAR
jgi:16S rRNA (cytosine1402-N4)-methyltransferase